MARKLLLTALLSLCGAALLLAGCSDGPKPPLTPTFKTSLSKDEVRNSAFQKEFPLQYATWLRTEEDRIMTKYGGSIPFRKNDNVNPLPKGNPPVAQPYLKNLWLGFPFMYEYDAARGHYHAVYDMLNIDRVNQYNEGGDFPAACYTCKTTLSHKWVAEYGDAFFSMPVNQFRTKDKIDEREHTIGCTTCHDPQTMELVIISTSLDEALKRQGKDWRNATRNEMRSLVCAQCHVEYYFEGPEYMKDGQKVKGVNRKPVFPWDKGMNPADMFEYYKEYGWMTGPAMTGFEGWYADWIHPVSQVPSIKMQHPEFEAWASGPHGAAGVSCADCHMPYVRMDGKRKISSHHVTSPLKTPDGIRTTCGQCHTDKTPEFLRARVEYTQDKTYENLLKAQAMNVKAHESLRLAREWGGSKHPDYDKLIINAKELTRKGQLFWDFVSAENSVGFHNPALLLDTLFKSFEYSEQAVNYAVQATNYGIAPRLEGDIKEIVPPILEWNRAMHMDPAIKNSTHTWTSYLPEIPRTERMWQGQERIR